MAYGIITQIIPQPDMAQSVLIDLFASTQIASLHDSSTQTTCTVVRLARLRALAAKPVEAPVSAGSEPHPGPNDDLPKCVFELTFTKGYTLEAVAERLAIAHPDALKAMRDYVRRIHTR